MRSRLIAVFGSAMYPVIFKIIPQRLPSAQSSWSATGKSLKFFCYRTSARHDAITEKPENNADAWLPCWGLTDVDLDVLLRADKIDILANLAGHSAGNRIPALARTHSNHRLGPLRRERHESDGLHPSRSRYHAAGGCQALCRERRGIVLRAEFVPP